MCLANLIFGKWSKSKKIAEQVQSSDLLGPLPGIKIYLIFEYPHFMLGFVLPNKIIKLQRQPGFLIYQEVKGKCAKPCDCRNSWDRDQMQDKCEYESEQMWSMIRSGSAFWHGADCHINLYEKSEKLNLRKLRIMQWEMAIPWGSGQSV